MKMKSQHALSGGREQEKDSVENGQSENKWSLKRKTDEVIDTKVKERNRKQTIRKKDNENMKMGRI